MSSERPKHPKRRPPKPTQPQGQPTPPPPFSARSPEKEGTPLAAPMDQAAGNEVIKEAMNEAIAPPRKTPVSKRSRRPAATRPAPSLDLNALLEQVRPILLRLQTAWGFALPRLRSVLPASLNEKLSDRALTGLVAGILVLLLWTTPSLFSANSPKVAQPPAIPELPPAGLDSPQPQASELEAPGSNRPVASPAIAPAPQSDPQPALGLTPEQSLIAAIQDQVAEVTDRYANGLIQTVEANFRSSRLMVKVSPGWYNLPSDRQDQLANEMLQRSRELDFSKLEMTAPDGLLLARSPVVGDNMVILRRAATAPDRVSLQSPDRKPQG